MVQQWGSQRSPERPSRRLHHPHPLGPQTIRNANAPPVHNGLDEIVGVTEGTTAQCDQHPVMSCPFAPAVILDEGDQVLSLLLARHPVEINGFPGGRRNAEEQRVAIVKTKENLDEVMVGLHLDFQYHPHQRYKGRAKTRNATLQCLGDLLAVAAGGLQPGNRLAVDFFQGLLWPGKRVVIEARGPGLPSNLTGACVSSSYMTCVIETHFSLSC